jgi:hypothetical protein
MYMKKLSRQLNSTVMNQGPLFHSREIDTRELLEWFKEPVGCFRARLFRFACGLGIFGPKRQSCSFFLGRLLPRLIQDRAIEVKAEEFELLERL